MTRRTVVRELIMLSFVVSIVCLVSELIVSAQTPPPQSPTGQPVKPATAPYACEPVNPDATPEARVLLKKLCDLSGKGILTGQHNFPNNLSQHSDLIYEMTG
jgi:hypothetical protein